MSDDDWPCKFDVSPELEKSRMNLFSGHTISEAAKVPGASSNGDIYLTFPSGPTEDDDEVTESKIRAFLHEKGFNRDMRLIEVAVGVKSLRSIATSILFLGQATEMGMVNIFKRQMKVFTLAFVSYLDYKRHNTTNTSTTQPPTARKPELRSSNKGSGEPGATPKTSRNQQPATPLR
ncbi:hypothetical protein RHSIM_Rhsim12G0103200 [Rhododendron simsii]|uniref:Uncharacterized protein n=1 Tax=Rhododendron simsii TaxID=118357 RepID=A0A834G506_RHOSS|nr:hypothetical protein RHSIM_Rhsim12G0103200 [Rhododendron simsii]